MQEIYFDNAASTPIDPQVQEIISNLSQDKLLGNASSVHLPGSRASKIIEKSRSIIAKKINAKSSEIYFTSGGTESNNMALKGVFFNNYPKKIHFISSVIEHPSILSTLKYLETLGAEVTLLPVNTSGVISTKDLGECIRKNTALVSIMHANNETGVIQPVEEIGKICSDKNILFHCDASQSFTKIDIDVKKFNIDLITISGHKICGPKGVGAIFVNERVKLTPLIHGGDQENGLRSGSYNLEAISGLGNATSLSSDEQIQKINECKKYLIEKLEKNFKVIGLNGVDSTAICSILNFRLEGINARELFLALNDENIYISTGSACAANKTTPSYVLKAMGLNDKQVLESVRVSFSKYNTQKEIDIFIGFLKSYVEKKSI